MAVPLFNNIETSCTSFQSPETLIYKGSDEKISKNLYTLVESDFAKYKKLSEEVSEALRLFSKNDKLVEKGRVMQSCGFSLDFYDDRLVKSEFCRIRLCPMCQRRRALKTYSDISKIVNRLPGYVFLHLVLTVPNCSGDDLLSTIDFMNRCSSKFFSLEPIKKAFKGVIRCLEVSYNSKRKDFHPHFHCLIAVRKSYFKSRDYIKYVTIQFLWSVLWKYRDFNLRSSKFTLEYILSRQLSILDYLQVYISRADEGSLPEIAKYCVKPLEFDSSLSERARVLDVLYSVLNGRRLIFYSGIFKVASYQVRNFDSDRDLPDINDDEITTLYWNYYNKCYEVDSDG